MDENVWAHGMASPVTRLTQARFPSLHKVNCCNTSSKYDTDDEVHKRQNTTRLVRIFNVRMSGYMHAAARCTLRKKNGVVLEALYYRQ
jgi:hypothetical protein